MAVQEAERLKEKVAELQRRCEDTNRAYEQASGEAARKQSRIDELEKQLQASDLILVPINTNSLCNYSKGYTRSEK